MHGLDGLLLRVSLAVAYSACFLLSGPLVGIGLFEGSLIASSCSSMSIEISTVFSTSRKKVDVGDFRSARFEAPSWCVKAVMIAMAVCIDA